MASPITVVGDTPIITVHTSQYTTGVEYDIPPIDKTIFGQKLITIVDVDGQASLTNPITIVPISGASFDDGPPSYSISIPFGSFTFTQIATTVYTTPKTIIQGNTLPGLPKISISTPTIYLSTAFTQSSLTVLNTLEANNIFTAGTIFALNGFQQSLSNSSTVIPYISAVTVSTGSIDVQNLVNLGGINAVNLTASSISTALYNANSTIASYATSISTIERFYELPSLELFASSGHLYAGRYMIDNEMITQVPLFYKNLQVYASSATKSFGQQNLSKAITDTPNIYNANPGLSTFSTYVGTTLPNYSGAAISSLLVLVSTTLSTTAYVVGLSSLALVVGQNLVNLAPPFTILSLSNINAAGLSSIAEGPQVSTLYQTFAIGASTVAAGSRGIFTLQTALNSMYITTDIRPQVSSLSTIIGTVSSVVDYRAKTSTLLLTEQAGFSSIGNPNQISSLSSILGFSLIDIGTAQGVSSLSSFFAASLVNIDVRTSVSTLSSVISYGFSTVSTFSREISSLSTSITLSISSFLDLGISSLYTNLSRGASTMNAGPGLSSILKTLSSSLLNVSVEPGLSSLSTTFGLGIIDVIGSIVPDASITFSTLYTSSLGFGANTTNNSITLVNGVLLVNNIPLQPPNNNFERPSTLSTYNVFVGSTTTIFSPVTTTWLSSCITLTASTVNALSTTSITPSGSLLIDNMQLVDVGNKNIYQIYTTPTDLLYNNTTLLNKTSGPGISSLSSFFPSFLSSIPNVGPSLYSFISSGLSSIAQVIPGISSLSSFYETRILQTNLDTGISTVWLSVSSLTTSNILNANTFNAISTFVCTINTSVFQSQNVNSFAQNGNSYMITSSISTSMLYLSSLRNTVYVNIVDALNFNISTFGPVQNPITVENLNASSISVNTMYVSSLFIQDGHASYTIPRPLPFSTFFPMYMSNSFLYYNSTGYNVGVKYQLPDFSKIVSANTFFTSSLNVQIINTSSITFTGQVQFDRLVVLQSSFKPLFLATQVNGTGSASNGLYTSPDGITWSQVVSPGPNTWVGRAQNDASYPSPVAWDIAWNGNYALAYSKETTYSANASAAAYLSNAISYDGVNWTPVPRWGSNTIPPGTTVANGDGKLSQQLRIFWDGSKWFKMVGTGQGSGFTSTRGNYESTTCISVDAFNWAPYTWNVRDTGSNSYFNDEGTLGSVGVSGYEYNGNTLMGWASYFNSKTPAGGCNAVSYSLDLVNSRHLLTAGGNELGFINGTFGNADTFGVNQVPKPWSDGFAWWMQGKSNVGTSLLARIYPYRNSDTSGLTSNQNNGAITWCTHPDLESAAIFNCGHYNGQMHVAGTATQTSVAQKSSLSLLYSYDGIIWRANPSQIGPQGNVNSVTFAQGKWIAACSGNVDGLGTGTGAAIWYSYDGLNWNPATGGPTASYPTVSGTPAPYSIGCNGYGADHIIYMRNNSPSIDLNGIRIYNQPGGFSWNNPQSREQTIVAFQSSILIQNILYITSNANSFDGSATQVGINNVNPKYSLDVNGSFAAERITTNALYIIPSTFSEFSSFSTSYGREILPLSSFNTFVLGSSFTQSLSLNVSTPLSVVDISGMAMFRSQSGGNPAAVAAFLNQVNIPNLITPPSVFNQSTGMTIYYRSGGTNYRVSYAGSNFFTGQHVCKCLDISAAVMNNVSYVGYLTSSADQGYLSMYDSNTKFIGSNAINITEALPVITFTSKDKDPSVFGVITDNRNTQFASDGGYALDSDPLWGNDLWNRVRVNSLGEGAMWVTNINGNISNGDYLCGSVIPGYARRQDDNIMYNYTAAKATMSCDFTIGNSNYVCEEIVWNQSTFLKAFIGCTYHCA